MKALLYSLSFLFLISCAESGSDQSSAEEASEAKEEVVRDLSGASVGTYTAYTDSVVGMSVEFPGTYHEQALDSENGVRYISYVDKLTNNYYQLNTFYTDEVLNDSSFKDYAVTLIEDDDVSYIPHNGSYEFIEFNGFSAVKSYGESELNASHPNYYLGDEIWVYKDNVIFSFSAYYEPGYKIDQRFFNSIK